MNEYVYSQRATQSSGGLVCRNANVRRLQYSRQYSRAIETILGQAREHARSPPPSGDTRLDFLFLFSSFLFVFFFFLWHTCAFLPSTSPICRRSSSLVTFSAFALSYSRFRAISYRSTIASFVLVVAHVSEFPSRYASRAIPCFSGLPGRSLGEAREWGESA